MRFSLGVNYWPRRAGSAMWRRFDAGELAEDFARIAALGLDTVRFFLRWSDFQPQADRIDAVMLERFERLVSLVAEAGLRAMPTLCCGHRSGVNDVPAWAVDSRTRARRYPSLVNGTISPFGVRDYYRGPMLDAQLRLARAVAERVRGHAAVFAWDIAHAFTDVCEPSHAKASAGEHSPALAGERVVAEWSRRLASALREFGDAAVTAGTHADDVTFDRGIRLGSLCAPLAFASMQGSTVRCAFARGRLDPEAIPFLAMVTAGWSGKPVVVTGLGNPSCPAGTFSAFERFAMPHEPPNLTISPDDGVFATYPCLTEAENAAYCAAVLERLHRDGRLGALWWCWSDPADRTSGDAPCALEPYHAAYGIIRGDGTERPVAAALAAFARAGHEVVPARDMPMISGDYYYRTLPSSTKTLYDAYLAFVAERRAA